MDTASLLILQREITELEERLADKKRRLAEVQDVLKKQNDDPVIQPYSPSSEINNHSPPETKIALFRSLFGNRIQQRDISQFVILKCFLSNGSN